MTEAFRRARRAQQAVGAHVDRRAAGDPAAVARPAPRPAVRDHRPDLLGVRQGPQGRLRRAAARRTDRPLLRPHRRTGTSTPQRGRRRRARASPGSRSTASPRASSASSRRGTTRSRWRCATRCRRCWRATPWSTSPTRRPCSPHCSASQLLEEAGLPPDLWQVVAGPGARDRTGDDRPRRLRLLHRLDRDRQAGRQQCADRLIGCSLELGGKNPMLVLRDADLDRAAEGAVRACFSNAGQLCVSIERMFVADQVYDRFVDRFVARVKAMRLRPALGWGADMGSLIGQQQLDTVTRTSRTPVAKGATRARRRPGAAGPRALLLRADGARGRDAGDDRASATRPSGRWSRSTGSPTRPTRSRAPTTASTA